MKNGIIVVLLLIIIAGGIYFIEMNRKHSDNPSSNFETINNSDLIQETVRQTKTVLPMKVDAMTTFVDIIGGKNDITYLYDVDMDLSNLPPQQSAILREKFPKIICPQMVPLICSTGKVFLEKGIVINTKYKAKDGKSIVECHYSKADCAKLPQK